MEISVIDSILIRNPLFANLTEADRLNVYNQAYSEVYQMRAEPIPLYQPTSEDVAELFPKITGEIQALNLSAIKNVDNLLKEHELLKDLTVNERLAIYKIVQHQINNYRSFLTHQEYFFATIRADTREYKQFALVPGISYTVTATPMFTDTNYFTPGISYALSIANSITDSFYLEPTLSNELVNINQTARTISIEPFLGYALEINPADMYRNMNFEPNLNYLFFTTPLKQSTLNFDPGISYYLNVGTSGFDREDSMSFEPGINYELKPG